MSAPDPAPPQPSNAAYNKEADIAGVTQKLTESLKRDLEITSALEQRVQRFEQFMAGDLQAEERERVVSALQFSLDVLAQPIKFGSHRDTMHCHGCHTLRGSAQRALLVGRSLQAAIQLYPIPPKKLESIVQTLHHCETLYVVAFLNGESAEIKTATSYMIETSACIDSWTTRIRGLLVQLLPGPNQTEPETCLPRLNGNDNDAASTQQ